MHHIYKIENLINGKVYIGQTNNISKRWSDHRAAAKHNRPPQIIHYAFIKYGLNNFIFDILASCVGIDEANDLEATTIAQYNSYKNGYKVVITRLKLRNGN